jgi:hypothetical protein
VEGSESAQIAGFVFAGVAATAILLALVVRGMSLFSTSNWEFLKLKCQSLPGYVRRV